MLGQWPGADTRAAQTSPEETRMPVQRRVVDVAGLAPANGYSHAVVSTGATAYVAGQVAVDEEGAVVGPGDVGAQTAQALRNLGLVLGELGAGWADVVKLCWYVLDARDVQAVRDARDAVLDPALGGAANPASTLVQVAALFRPGFLVEVDAVVALPS
jgi:enamine deaminase RidA (YjgF/YER057c/UK114 family)